MSCVSLRGPWHEHVAEGLRLVPCCWARAWASWSGVRTLAATRSFADAHPAHGCDCKGVGPSDAIFARFRPGAPPGAGAAPPRWLGCAIPRTWPSQCQDRPCGRARSAETCATTHKFCPSCGFPVAKVAQNTDDPLIGRTLPGGYVILDLVGIGGMGRVYRAEQTNLGRTVAVKIIHPHLVGEENAAARFITEARAASRLNHPNSVAVIDFGKTEDGQLYLVMEFLRGKDLARVQYEEGPLSVPSHRQHPAAGARGALRSAPPRDHPPRSQARERHPRAGAHRRRLREGRRLRPREDARRGAGAEHHEPRHRVRHARVHEPRAGPRRSARRALRPLRRRRHPLPAPHGPAAVRGREPDAGRAHAHHRGAARSARASRPSATSRRSSPTSASWRSRRSRRIASATPTSSPRRSRDALSQIESTRPARARRPRATIRCPKCGAIEHRRRRSSAASAARPSSAAPAAANGACRRDGPAARLARRPRPTTSSRSSRAPVAGEVVVDRERAQFPLEFVGREDDLALARRSPASTRRARSSARASSATSAWARRACSASSSRRCAPTGDARRRGDGPTRAGPRSATSPCARPSSRSPAARRTAAPRRTGRPPAPRRGAGSPTSSSTANRGELSLRRAPLRGRRGAALGDRARERAREGRDGHRRRRRSPRDRRREPHRLRRCRRRAAARSRRSSS